jgi:hypothetical protein
MSLNGELTGVSNPIIAADLQSLLTGLAPGVGKDQQAFWRDARDVMFDSSSIRPSSGAQNLSLVSGTFDEQTGMFDSATGLFDVNSQTFTWPPSTFIKPIKGIHQQKQSTGHALIVVGTDTDLVTFDTVNLVVSSYNTLGGVDYGSDVANITLWSFEQWGDWVVASNGIDTPKLLKKNLTNNFVTLPGFAAVANTAEIFRTLGPAMLAFNTNNAPNQLLACKPDDVETWDYTTNPTAVELTVRDFQGPVIAVERMGRNLALYGEAGLHILTYGGAFLYGAVAGARGISAVSKNSIAVVGSLHYAIQENGIFKTDGMNIMPCAAMQLGDWLRRNINWNQRSRIASLVDHHRNLIKWALPLVGSDTLNITLLYNYMNDTISFESDTFTCAARAMALRVPLAGYSSGAVRMIVDNPVGRVPYLISRPFPLAEKRDTWVYVDVLQARMSESGLSWYVRYGQNLSDFDDAARSNPWILLGSNIGEDESTVYVTRETVYLQLKLVGEPDMLWHLNGIDAHGNVGGRRF